MNHEKGKVEKLYLFTCLFWIASEFWYEKGQQDSQVDDILIIVQYLQRQWKRKTH